jgi:ribosomal protein S18 acetylase RimI-like enzyme
MVPDPPVPTVLELRTVHVRPATLEEIPALAAVLARAFVDDPIIRWTLPVPDVEATLRREFGTLDTAFASEGHVLTVESMNGVALWLPSESPLDLDELAEVIAEDLEAAGPHALTRYVHFWEWAEAKRPAGPHMYLDHVGVDPAAQGTGVGSALLRVGLDRADELGVPAFLCTGREDNAEWYRRAGFRTVERVDAPEEGPTIWFMIRDPA